MTMVYGSRILIERVLRDKVRGLANVTIREGVIGERADVGGGTATGGSPGSSFTASPATSTSTPTSWSTRWGAAPRSADWLVAAGWPEPQVQTLDAKVTYTSRWYELPAPSDRRSWWWQHLVVMPTRDKGEHPAEHEFLVNFFPIEGNRVIACMGSWGHRHAAHRRRRSSSRPAGCGRRCSRPRWTGAPRPRRST